MKKITEKIKYWGQLLLLPLYGLSFLIPRSKKIWLFGSTFGRRFADNPRYFYLYMSQNSEKLDIRAVWISHDKSLVEFLNSNGYEAYYYHSLKGIWMALRGRVYIFDNYSKDINFWQSAGALKVNLWHGIPLKKIQADNVFDNVRHPKNAWEKFKYFPRRLSDEKPSHYVLTTAEYMVPIFSSAFRTEHVLTSGYPRNDSIFEDRIENLYTPTEKKSLENIAEKMKTKGLKMVYYMPTFRDTEKMFFDVVNLSELENILKKHGLLLCVKLHPKSKLKKEFDAISSEHIYVIDADTDPYVFIKDSSALISDYSSIYFDYLLSGKPVIFFDYDLKEYLSQSREMYFDYEEFTPGIKAKNLEELDKAFADVVTGNDEYKAARENIKLKVITETKTSFSENLYDDIVRIIGKN